MNTNFYFKQQLSSQFDLIYGLTLTHFSNGNTKFPNAGLNATEVKVGLTYNFNREINDKRISRDKVMLPINDDGEPDFEYMGQYMMYLEYQKRNQYLDYIQSQS